MQAIEWSRSANMGDSDRKPQGLQREHRRLLAELRARYLDGTIDEILIPEDADVSGLIEAVERAKTDPPAQA